MSIIKVDYGTVSGGGVSDLLYSAIVAYSGGSGKKSFTGNTMKDFTLSSGDIKCLTAGTYKIAIRDYEGGYSVTGNQRLDVVKSGVTTQHDVKIDDVTIIEETLAVNDTISFYRVNTSGETCACIAIFQ